MSINADRLRSIWHLTWPQVIMLLCQFIIGMTDVWAGGRIGAGVQASIGLITQCQLLFMALAMAAVSGAVASISQSLGAGKRFRAQRYVGLVVLGGISLGAFIATAAYSVRHPFLVLVQTPPDIMPTALLFFAAYMLGLPGQYALTIGAAVFRSAKSVLMPLYITGGVAICNVFGDLAFGLGWWGFPGYGAAGIAWTTTISVSTGAVLMLTLLVRERLLTRRSLPRWRWVRSGAPYLFKVAGPALGTSFLWQCGYLVLFVITASLPSGSTHALAGLTAGLRVEGILFLPAVACSMTASVLVGHSLGMCQREEAKRVMLIILGCSCLGMTLVGMALWPFRPELAGFLTPDPIVRQETVNYLTFNILSVPFTVGSIVLAGALNGAGATIYPLAAFSFSIWMIRLPLAWYLGHWVWENSTGIYLSMLISQIIQSSLLFWIALRCNWSRFAMSNRCSSEKPH